MSDTSTNGVYGLPPQALCELPAGAVQYSPLMPGARDLADEAPGSLASLAMLAPPGTIERHYAIALGLRALAVGAPFTILAPRDRGGARLAASLEAFGCTIEDEARKHHRICHGLRPAQLQGLDEAIEAGAPRLSEDLGLWTQPGIFSWDRIDPGSALLLDHLAELTGIGADFGGGLGLLARQVLQAPKVKALTLVEIDRRAVEAARRNIEDPRLKLVWGDLREPNAILQKLDFIVMNPPFHEGGSEDRSLGQLFIRKAAAALRNGGTLWLTANRHLPYESLLTSLFKTVTPVAEAQGYKVFEARK